MLAESKAKCALGASMPQAFKMASSIVMELAVGEFGGAKRALSSAFFGAAFVVAAAVFGSGFGSEPHPMARTKKASRVPVKRPIGPLGLMGSPRGGQRWLTR